MQLSIKLTSKRQATFPASVCQELGVKAGDNLILEQIQIDGQPSWILKPKKNVSSPWFSSLHEFSQGKSHDMAEIRASIGKTIDQEKK